MIPYAAAILPYFRVVRVMQKPVSHFFAAFVLLQISFLAAAASVNSSEVAKDAPYRLIEWIDLMPASDLEALLNPPEILSMIEDGSQMDSMDNEETKKLLKSEEEKYFAALTSTKVVQEFDGKKIRLPGFIVPLDFTDDQLITSFFFVPYFGACLHMPPPPPNQILYARFKQGLQIETLDTAFWIEGTLNIEKNENSLGMSAYAMNVDQAFVYEE